MKGVKGGGRDIYIFDKEVLSLTQPKSVDLLAPAFCTDAFVIYNLLSLASATLAK